MAKQKKKVTRVRRRRRKNIERGQAHIQSTFNNTIITLTDVHGNAISWASSGQLGFKGSRKSTPFASQMAAETAAKAAMEHGLKSVEVFVKRTRFRKRSCYKSFTSHWIRSSNDQRCYSNPTQRM